MPRSRKIFLSRASRAFSSLAISCVLTLLALAALSLGLLQDLRAEGTNVGVMNAVMTTNGFVGGEPQAVSSVTSVASRGNSQLPWISRRPVAGREAVSPAREVFGLSKVAFPLLVSDVTPSVQTGKAVVMSGRTVGVR
jgi:hypothetical protein